MPRIGAGTPIFFKQSLAKFLNVKDREAIK